MAALLKKNNFLEDSSRCRRFLKYHLTRFSPYSYDVENVADSSSDYRYPARKEVIILTAVKGHRAKFTKRQLSELEKLFEKDNYILYSVATEVAKKLSLRGDQIKIWFKNRRRKMRNKLSKKNENNFINGQLLKETTTDNAYQLGEYEESGAAAKDNIDYSGTLTKEFSEFDNIFTSANYILPNDYYEVLFSKQISCESFECESTASVDTLYNQSTSINKAKSDQLNSNSNYSFHSNIYDNRSVNEKITHSGRQIFINENRENFVTPYYHEFLT